MNRDVSQIRIAHLSDLHFGVHHRFNPPRTPAGDPAAGRGRPSLLESLQQDWQLANWDAPEWLPDENLNPLLIAVTGDLTQTAAPNEFQQARAFIEGLIQSTPLSSPLTKDDIFVAPGNHDVIFTESDVESRWQPYRSFYRDVLGENISPTTPHNFTRVRDYSRTSGVVVAELNSCVYVQQGSTDEQRGQIDEGSLTTLQNELEIIDVDDLRRSIRIAIVHHHPIVLPALAEAGRGYDAIVNADKLLRILQDFGFHLVLHGHKHYPYTFSYDAVCAWTREPIQPLMVVAGGSVASDELPKTAHATNTYNMISVKWHPTSRQARIKVETRALVTHDTRGRELLPTSWRWQTIRVDDRQLVPQQRTPSTANEPTEISIDWLNDPHEIERSQVYAALRGNMPVVEVRPSLEPRQAYEASVWVVSHGRKLLDTPVEVIWSAGRWFEFALMCRAEENPQFCAKFHYWGPMLIQVKMKFADQTWATGYVYARIPEGYDSSEDEN